MTLASGMPGPGAVVITSIAEPNAVMRRIAADCAALGLRFIVIGDRKSPPGFALEGCDYFDLAAQGALEFAYARACPVGHYARKNIGYLVALAGGAEFVAETDDDNFPRAEFYQPLPRRTQCPRFDGAGWVNLYGYYSDAPVWPRGFPLDAINAPRPPLPSPSPVDAPIQQGLADENPDVDAIFRLTRELPLSFAPGPRRIALGSGSWCPYNSQNTIHYRAAAALLYLPAHCSFRMTDIWRSFVAQRIAWTCGWSVLFREPTVAQERNDHDLMRDFVDEIPGYIGNRAIAEALAGLDLGEGEPAIPDNLRRCYRRLVDDGHVGEAELALLDAWLADLKALR